QKTQLALDELQAVLNLVVPPRRIECYDISNTQGSSSVGAMVVFEGGRPKNSEYRRFKIKQVEGPNDIASHQELLRRRFRKTAGSSTLTSATEDSSASIGDTMAEMIQDSQQSQVAQPDTQNEKTSEMHHDWALPDLIIIDGGKGQLSGA